VLANNTPASSSKWLRCSLQRCDGWTFANQSTTRPRKPNNSASNTPVAAVNSVIEKMYGRAPLEQPQRKAKNLFGSTGTGPPG
jgi:hypothetical protein